MSTTNRIPIVAAAARRPTLGIQRSSITASSPASNNRDITSLTEEIKAATAKIALQEAKLSAQEQRIAALELLFLSSGNRNNGTAAGGGIPRKQRNPDVSREIRATFKEHQLQNNGVGVIIASDVPHAQEFNQSAKVKLIATSERLEASAASSSGSLAARAVKKRAIERANQHVKYQKKKARAALKDPEVVEALAYRKKLDSRRNVKRDRRHRVFVESSQKYMRTLGDGSVSFDAVNAIVKAATLMSDEEDEADSAPGTNRRVRIRPGFRSNQLNELFDLLDVDHAAEGKGALQHTITDTIIDDNMIPPKNFKGLFHKWGFSAEAWASADV